MESLETVNKGISNKCNLIKRDEVGVGRIEENTKTRCSRVGGLGSVPHVSKIDLRTFGAKETFHLGDEVIKDGVGGTSGGSFVQETASEGVSREQNRLRKLVKLQDDVSVKLSLGEPKRKTYTCKVLIPPMPDCFPRFGVSGKDTPGI